MSPLYITQQFLISLAIREIKSSGYQAFLFLDPQELGYEASILQPTYSQLSSTVSGYSFPIWDLQCIWLNHLVYTIKRRRSELLEVDLYGYASLGTLTVDICTQAEKHTFITPFTRISLVPSTLMHGKTLDGWFYRCSHV